MQSLFTIAGASTPIIRPAVNKREQLETSSLYLKFRFWADHLSLGDGRCLGVTSGRTRCLEPLSQWPDDIMRLVGCADDGSLHSWLLDCQVEWLAARFLCDNHQNQKGSLQSWLTLVAKYRAEFAVDIEMRDV